MPENRWFLKDEDSAYGEGILIDEYQGGYSLVVANQKNDGKIWMQWCFPQKRDGSKGAMDKSFPWKIKIGNSKKAAVETLKNLILRLEDRGPEGTNPGDMTPEGEEIPF